MFRDGLKGTARVARDEKAFGPVRAVLIAFAVLIVVNAILLARTDLPAQGWGLRGLHHLYQIGRGVAAALVTAAVIALARRIPWLTGRRAYLVLGLCSLLVGGLTLVEDVSSFAYSAVPSVPRLAVGSMVAIVAGGVVAAFAAGRLLDRPRLRWLAVLAGAAAMVVNGHILRNGYPAAHLFLGGAGIAIITGAMMDAPRPAWWPSFVRVLPWAVGIALGLFAIFVPPSNTLQLQLLWQEGDVVTSYLSRLSLDRDQGEAVLPGEWASWFKDRSAMPDVRPRRTPPVAAPVVLLLTIDSLRADVLDGSEDARLPNLAAFRDSSLYFTQARTPGSQTVYTISALFSGIYFSQQYWSKHETLDGYWPDDDETVRFPELLSSAGVKTFHLGSTKWLGAEHGLVRGFSDEVLVEAKVDERYAVSTETFPLIYERLAKLGNEPMFGYTHILDAHYTVSPRKEKASPRERYLANLETVDKSVAELLAKIEELGLADRTYVIITADHGEAFGEHGTWKHRTTLYEELLRVPLMIKGPRVPTKKVDTPVSIMDVAPTVLELFGQPIPAYFMGESLVPTFQRGNAKFTRPILAEGMLKKALFFPDGIKVIVDDRHHTQEVYDLAADPGELNNLVDGGDPRVASRVQLLRMFFETHQNDREGYTPPYRP